MWGQFEGVGCPSQIPLVSHKSLNDKFHSSQLELKPAFLQQLVFDLVQVHAFLRLEWCNVNLLHCLWLRHALVEPSLQLGRVTFLNLELIFQSLNVLGRGHSLPARTVLAVLSTHPVLDLCGQALVDITSIGQFHSLFKARGEVSINDHQLHIIHSPDPVGCFVRQMPRAVIDDLH